MNIAVKKGKFGRGVFAMRAFRAGDIIEVSPVIVVPAREVKATHRLTHYVFDWGRGYRAIALGFGSLFNHSTDPDAHFRIDKKRRKIAFVADKPIRRGQEIFVHYGYDPRDYPMKRLAIDR